MMVGRARTARASDPRGSAEGGRAGPTGAATGLHATSALPGRRDWDHVPRQCGEHGDTALPGLVDRRG